MPTISNLSPQPHNREYFWKYAHISRLSEWDSGNLKTWFLWGPNFPFIKRLTEHWSKGFPLSWGIIRKCLLLLGHLVVSDSLQPMDRSPPGSSIHGVLQARILEWAAISFSNQKVCPFMIVHIKYINNLSIILSLFSLGPWCVWCKQPQKWWELILSNLQCLFCFVSFLIEI